MIQTLTRVIKFLIIASVPATLYIRGLDSTTVNIIFLIFLYIGNKVIYADKDNPYNVYVDLLLTIYIFMNSIAYMYIYDSVFLTFWDEMMHFLSGGFTTFLFAFLLTFKFRKREISLKRWEILFIALLATISIGVIWEIIEYCVDTFMFGYSRTQADPNSSETSLGDTMTDMILATSAGVIVFGVGASKMGNKLARYIRKKLPL